MKVKEVVFHLRNVYDGKPWYGKSIKEIVLASDANDPIYIEILNHMIAWRTFALNNVRGISYTIETDSDEDWPRSGAVNRHEALETMADMNRDLIEVLSSKPDAWLLEKVPNTNYSFQFLLEGIIQHDIYHLGQIAILQKTKLPKKKTVNP